jgi:hypothetical protein
MNHSRMKKKRTKMTKKRNSLKALSPLVLAAIGFCCLINTSCSSDDYLKVQLNIPNKIPFDVDTFEEFILTDFLIKENVKDFDLNREIQEYFSAELSTRFKVGVEIKEEFTPTEEGLKSEASWKDFVDSAKKRVIFTGAVSYSQEVRKALLTKDTRRFEDPFPNKTQLAQRRFYSLDMDLYLIDAQTGKTIYMRTFKETKADKNPNQTAPFAFFQLIQRVKEKLFDGITGETRLQERYLIQK